jgi:WD40 repeat protein
MTASIRVNVVATRTMAVLHRIDTRLPYEPQLTFSPAGQFLAIEWGNSLDIYGVRDERRFTLHNAAGGLFSPGAELYAYTSHDHSVHLWYADENGRQATLAGHQSRITGIVFSSNGRLLASVCSNQCIVWDVGSGVRLCSLPNTRMTRRPPTISPDGHLLAWPTSGSRVCSWPADGGIALGTIDTTSTCLSTAFSPDGRLFAGLTNNGVIEVWDVIRSLASRREFSQKVSYITTSTDGKLLACSLHGGLVRVMAKDDEAFRLLLTTTSNQPTS